MVAKKFYCTKKMLYHTEFFSMHYLNIYNWKKKGN